MYNNNLDLTGMGMLVFNVFDTSIAKPLIGAKVVVSREGEDILTIFTDDAGKTGNIELETPPISYSLSPDQPQPYTIYNAVITADGFQSEIIEGMQIYPDVIAIEDIALIPLALAESPANIVIIPEPALYGDYPSKIPEEEQKDIQDESGFVVLDKVVIPEFIVVHDGRPDDNSANNYWIPYKDYIKNVASSEIYSTWADSAIRANVLAINSFTLNRVYTEWYRSRGKDFTITNSTQYDQFFVKDRNIFKNISTIVDEMFTTYIKRPNQRQPLLTQYCDGQRVSCPNWLSQWGSQNLAEQGYSTIQILRYYYGNDIFLENAEKVTGVPSSYPGYALEIGSNSNDVKTIQFQLNKISNNYPSITKVKEDGVFGEQTKQAVLTFQGIFNMPKSGIVDFSTWYEISKIYVAVSRLA
ncbi:MAG: peptidoglycan-binding protein [bacterium]